MERPTVKHAAIGISVLALLPKPQNPRAVRRIAAPKNPASGISSFDGQEWATFSTEDGLAGSRVNDIFVASDGLWVGHEGAGFSYFDGSTWSTYLTDDVLPENDVNAVVVAPDGAAWLATGSGLTRFDGREWSTYTWDDGLPSDVILAVDAAADGTIWAGRSSYSAESTRTDIAASAGMITLRQT